MKPWGLNARAVHQRDFYLGLCVRHRSTQRPLETHHITLASNLKLKQSIINAFVLPLGKWYTQTDWGMSFSLRYDLHHGYRGDASLNFVALV